MRSIPTMASLTDGLVAEVVRVSKIRKYEKAEIIILEGSSDPWIYFLVHGELEVNHQGVVLHRLNRFGDMFGEMGLIDGGPRSATVKACAPSLCLALDASLFTHMEESSRVALKNAFNQTIAENMAERLREANKTIAGSAPWPPVRLAR
ncbi:MAG: cyclic nucleotide-binding domain-containing protein [Humidesulfovibrio sp.]|nr:cyclic nucleotide-binding domain-containing protein [Humidesulfovibrio sp.]